MRGTGLDGTTPTTGYDAYGSVGAYRLSVSGCGVTPGAPGPPGAPGLAFSGTTAKLAWTAPSDPGGSAVTGYRITVDGVQHATVAATNVAVTGLRRGQAYRFGVAAVNAEGPARPSSAPPPCPPSSRVPRASSGPRRAPPVVGSRPRPPGGRPSTTVGADVTRYRVKAFLLDSEGEVVRTCSTNPFSGDLTSIEVQLPVRGRYRFSVAALNKNGWGGWSTEVGRRDRAVVTPPTRRRTAATTRRCPARR